MTARNDITGDAIQTKGSNDAYRDAWDRIFGKKRELFFQTVGKKKAADEPVFHLRSHGDVSAEDLETYVKRSHQYTPQQVEEMCKPWEQPQEDEPNT